jgi:hypothetical protein
MMIGWHQGQRLAAMLSTVGRWTPSAVGTKL